jgi:hypothetical protein
MQLGGPSNLHKDILENRDCSINWEDVYKGELRRSCLGVTVERGADRA